MNYREVDKIFRKNVWVNIGQNGSHVQYMHISTGRRCPVPNHNGKDLGKGLLCRIEKSTGLSLLKR